MCSSNATASSYAKPTSARHRQSNVPYCSNEPRWTTSANENTQNLKTMCNNREKKLPRGLRNNNPGNIRISKTKYLGEVQPSQDSAFKQFQSIDYGYRAMFVLLEHYYKARGLKTIRQIINRYAPTSENNTEAYIQQVASICFRSADEEIDITNKDEMVLLVSAMSRVENGRVANVDDVLRGWNLYQRCRP